MTKIRLSMVLIALGLPMVAPHAADAAMVLPDVGTIDFSAETRSVTLAIPTGARKNYRVSWVAQSRRLSVEVDGMFLPGRRTLYMNRGVVTVVRAEPLSGNRARVVFELSAPADLRTLTHAPANTLLFAIHAAGEAQVAIVSQTSGATDAKPRIARRAPMPAPRITPEPLADSQVPVAIAVPTPEPSVPLLQRPPVPVATPMPLSEPVVPATEPALEPPSEPQPVPKETQVFGTRVAGGTELPLSFRETFADGNADLDIGVTSAGVVSYQQMFSPYIGMSLEGRGMRYAFTDSALKDTGFEVKRSRLDMEGNLSIQGRFPLGGGIELMGRLGPAARMVNVATAVTAPDADGNPTQRGDVTVSDYLSSSWQAFGLHSGLGFGYQMSPMFGLNLTGGINYLLAGGMADTNVPTILPMLGWRGALETRFDLGMIGLSLGYSANGYSGGAGALSQFWHGPLLKLGISY